MELLFSILESLAFIGGSLDSLTSESLVKEYIYNSKVNEDKELMLVLILMMYLSYNDDHYISSFEKNRIEEYYTENLKPFSKDYLQVLRKVKNRIWNVEEVCNYVEYNKISINKLKEIIFHLEKEIFTKDKYKKSFFDLKKSLEIEEKYLRRILSISN
jgi:hypothetical protein